MRAWPLVLLVIGGCTVPTPTPARPLAAPPTPALAVVLVTPTTAVSAPKPTSASPPIPPSIATIAPTRPPLTAAAASVQGIVLGKPVALGGARVVGVLATNTTDVVKTFTLRATYTQDGRTVATAAGAVNDLLPGQTRAALLASTDQIPTGAQSVRLDVGSVVDESPTTPGARAAGLIRFGATRALPSPPSVELEVTNGDQAAHTLTVQAALLRGDELVGVAVGAVNDLAPGATKRAALTVQGTTEGHDRVLPAVQTVVR